MRRRTLLQQGLGLAVGASLPGWRSLAAAPAFDPRPGPWRSFELTTRLALKAPEGAAKAWIPLPSIHADDWIRPLGNRWTTNGTAVLHRDPPSGAELVYVAWPSGETAPTIEVVSQVATRDRAVDLTRPHATLALSAHERAHYTAPSELVPTDGIVRSTAEAAIAGSGEDLAKAQCLYEWVVDNTYRKATTRGCGTGDVASLLKSGHFGGKCADLNALFVGLARAAGLPARDLYGIRVARSEFGYQALGANSAVISKAQHCRAEVHLAGFGWVPMDPADVRKVVLEEPPGNLPIDDPRVVAARRTLFGAWETNWVAYNDASDLALPGSDGPRVPFLMYPQAETGAGRLDSLDPEALGYQITVRELTA
jgi:transglutaminase-like putative cysteine protease